MSVDCSRDFSRTNFAGWGISANAGVITSQRYAVFQDGPFGTSTWQMDIPCRSSGRTVHEDGAIWFDSEAHDEGNVDERGVPAGARLRVRVELCARRRGIPGNPEVITLAEAHHRQFVTGSTRHVPALGTAGPHFTLEAAET